jgi:hypothetical protein
LYQGVAEHLIGWLRNLIGDVELDAMLGSNDFHPLMVYADSGAAFLDSLRFQDLSTRSRKDICKEFLGCLLGSSSVPFGAIRASRALLYFLYLVQYPNHFDKTLAYLQSEFHANKEFRC